MTVDLQQQLGLQTALVWSLDASSRHNWFFLAIADGVEILSLPAGNSPEKAEQFRLSWLDNLTLPAYIEILNKKEELLVKDVFDTYEELRRCECAQDDYGC